MPALGAARDRGRREPHCALLGREPDRACGAAGVRYRPRCADGGGVMAAVLQAEDLTKHFRAKRGLFGGERGTVRAGEGISFAIERGETLGVVGESGYGKTTTAKLVLGLEEPTGGMLRFEGNDLAGLDAAGGRRSR